ncbi:MAG: MerR family transcriptional regulator [Nitriliruptoraceae bacterium]
MRAYTIGEVLNRLRDEFDDITIARIRFFETEGLIAPDRMESGYRKFAESDVERLTYILRAQRDRSLSLAAIRAELERVDAGDPVDPSVGPTEELADDGHGTTQSPTMSPPSFFDEDFADTSMSNIQLSASELADASGLSLTHVTELTELHFIRVKGSSYTATDLKIARICARLIDAGLEPRHLRMYRQFTDRELALIEQLVGPLLRQRNPDSRRAASAKADEIGELGAELKRVMLAADVSSLFDVVR